MPVTPLGYNAWYLLKFETESVHCVGGDGHCLGQC